MNDEILINFSPMETRVGVIENGMLQEVHVERNSRRGIVGNIYLGKVARVLPGMQAAFVDIGIDKAGFIHAADIVDNSHINNEHSHDNNLNINQLVHEGQALLVQVLKDPIGTKGARLSSKIAIASRFLVYMPYAQHVGVSQRIEDQQERERLKEIIIKSIEADKANANDGFILRTVAEGASASDLNEDINFLRHLWCRLEEQSHINKAPAIIYEDLPLYLRVLRDIAHPAIEKIRIDSKETFQKARDFVEQLVPELLPLLEHYPGERPIFDLYNVEEEIKKALGRKVPLKSGGYLIIDQMEAMTTVDVNTGAYVGYRNLEETIYRTNLEAARAIGRQLRLRNLGGIIILDFIDMEQEDHQRQVLRTLESVLEKDHVKTKTTGVSELGLIEMTRKRTRESLEQQICQPCEACDGTGMSKTPETVCFEIFREILRAVRAFDTETYLVLASQGVIDYMLDEETHHLVELEEFIGKPIGLQVESMYLPEQFDVVLR